MGKSRRARKLSVDFMGMKQIAWVDPDGSVLREEGILGIALERVTREEALAGLEGAVSADLTEIASIPSSKPIEGAAALRVLKIRLEGLQQGSFFSTATVRSIGTVCSRSGANLPLILPPVQAALPATWGLFSNPRPLFSRITRRSGKNWPKSSVRAIRTA